MDYPLATLRLASAKLDPGKVSDIMLHHNGDGHRSRDHDVRAHLEIITKPGVWMATTEFCRSKSEKDHLSRLTHLLSKHLGEIRLAFPDIFVTFSLLTFSESFKPEDLPKEIVSSATQSGNLEIEMAAKGEEIVLTDHSVERFAV